ncbi:2-dehydro-3-deoxygalactonokinase [Acidisphaera sp. L21]|uniref:2-dehydro-3-deoxygalactonokinase n=1 Tax=Acidisphaera sp. L21 TaxID=1641851 RepID=UPI00131B4B12|nr:2-dehydro-3-deoxygalactonokinase [Acidisphaera sp. L21]
MTGQPQLIALDWGTSSLRAFLMGADGAVLDTRAAPMGIMQVPAGGFPTVFADIAGAWLRDAPGLPAVACGMVGSAQGWQMAAYCQAPTGLAGLATSMLAVTTGSGPDLRIIPGISLDMDGTQPEVMRGEETQVFGALSLHPALWESARLVMPGTHCKWVSVQQGGIAGFQTFMTGELFAALQGHTILGRPARDAGQPATEGEAAFSRGIEAARGSLGGIAPLLFSARTLVLSGQLQAADSLNYLSGLLIGDELRCALPDAPGRLALIGDPALCDRYLRALALFGVTDAITITGATEAGLWQIACQAGLVGPQKDVA